MFTRCRSHGIAVSQDSPVLGYCSIVSCSTTLAANPGAVGNLCAGSGEPPQRLVALATHRRRQAIHSPGPKSRATILLPTLLNNTSIALLQDFVCLSSDIPMLPRPFPRHQCSIRVSSVAPPPLRVQSLANNRHCEGRRPEAISSSATELHGCSLIKESCCQ